MNTRVSYLYRDGANNKHGNDEVMAGTLTAEQVADIRRVCDEGIWFIPGEVGLSEIQTYWRDQGYAYPTDNDHAWCELNDPEPTDDPPTVEMTADAFYNRFVSISEWDVDGAMKRLGLVPA